MCSTTIFAIDAESAGRGLALPVGFFLSFRAVSPLFAAQVLGTDARAGTGASLAAGLLGLCLVSLTSLGTARHRIGSMLRLPTIRWIVLFLAVGGLSLGWSVTVSLPASLAYWCGLAVDVLTVVLLLRTGKTARVAESLMTGFVWSTCLLALIAWSMPAQSDLRLGDPDFFNTNQIGNLCAVALFFAQYLRRRELRRPPGRWAGAQIFLGVTLVRTLSKTTIVAFVIAETYLLVQDRSMSRKVKLRLAASAALLCLLFWGLFTAYYETYTTAGEGSQVSSLTGRTAIWAYVGSAAIQQPWIGHGFDSMWKVVPPFGPDRFEARHAENELLQQFYTYGIVGVVMLCGIYGSFYRSLRRLTPGPLKLISTSLLLFIVVRGFAEAEPFDLLLPLWVLVALSMLTEEQRVSDTMMTVPPALPDVTRDLETV